MGTLWAGSTAFAMFASHTNAQTLGIAFTSTAATTIGELRWFNCADTTANERPTRARLWRNSDGAVLADVTTIPGPMGVGWQSVSVYPTVTIAAATQYRIGFDFPGGGYRYIAPVPTTAGPVPDAGLALAAAGKYVQEPPAYPDTIAGIYVGIDVVTGTTGTPPSGGGGPPTTTGDLDSWLSSNASINAHQSDGLPWLSKEQQDAILALANLIKTGVDNTPKLTDPAWVTVLKLWQIAGALTDAEIAAWNLFAKRSPAQLTGSSGGGGSAFFSPDGRQVAASAAEAVDWGARQWHRTETSNWLTPVPGTDWSLEATLDWDAAFTWDQPADVYVMNITDYPDTWDQWPVAGRLWLPRAAWWAPITGDLTHERHFADIQTQVLHVLPMRCAGMLFVPRENFAGTMQAWRRPDP